MVPPLTILSSLLYVLVMVNFIFYRNNYDWYSYPRDTSEGYSTKTIDLDFHTTEASPHTSSASKAKHHTPIATQITGESTSAHDSNHYHRTNATLLPHRFGTQCGDFTYPSSRAKRFTRAVEDITKSSDGPFRASATVADVLNHNSEPNINRLVKRLDSELTRTKLMDCLAARLEQRSGHDRENSRENSRDQYEYSTEMDSVNGTDGAANSDFRWKNIEYRICPCGVNVSVMLLENSVEGVQQPRIVPLGFTCLECDEWHWTLCPFFWLASLVLAVRFGLPMLNGCYVVVWHRRHTGL